MLSVKSFLRKNDNFVPVSDFIGGIPDSDYIEGAIEILVQQKGLLTLEDWDYVDQLWCYFVGGLFEVVEGKEFETYLPEQPLKVVFDRIAISGVSQSRLEMMKPVARL